MFRLRDKRKRNEEIRRFKEEHPELTLREIAEKFNLSFQRISVILKK